MVVVVFSKFSKFPKAFPPPTSEAVLLLWSPPVPVAACMSKKSPFVSSISDREEARQGTGGVRKWVWEEERITHRTSAPPAATNSAQSSLALTPTQRGSRRCSSRSTAHTHHRTSLRRSCTESRARAEGQGLDEALACASAAEGPGLGPGLWLELGPGLGLGLGFEWSTGSLGGRASVVLA